MKKIFALVIGIFCAFGAEGLPLATASVMEGFWKGTLTYRDSELPIRIEITRQTGDLAAFLDIPSLIYAHQRLQIKGQEDGGITLDFPFGIGEISAFVNDSGRMENRESKILLVLEKTTPPPYSKKNITFGAFDPSLEGTVYIPEGQGPFPLVVLLAGSANASRGQWSYASWADFYARQGIAALIYDRRPDMFVMDNDEIMAIEDHARDVAAAIAKLKERPDVDGSKIGVAGSSRGAWIAMALGDMVPDLAFMVLVSPAPVTPAEQEVDSTLTGMTLDGLHEKEIAAARNYYRLYFFVAQTMEGWPLLEPLIGKAKTTTWGQYVDQPQAVSDLAWWHANMNFDAAGHLKRLKMPVLAFWGGDDFISPYDKYQGILRHALESSGNTEGTTRVFPNADHRIEIDPGVDSEGKWHWFGFAPGSLKAISDWIWDIIE